jgi:hypothetical protein
MNEVVGWKYSTWLRQRALSAICCHTKMEKSDYGLIRGWIGVLMSDAVLLFHTRRLRLL